LQQNIDPLIAKAKKALDGGASDELFYQTKLDLAEFYAKRELPTSGALRKKVEPNPSKPKYLVTEPWVGYRFAVPEAEATKP